MYYHIFFLITVAFSLTNTFINEFFSLKHQPWVILHCFVICFKSISNSLWLKPHIFMSKLSLSGALNNVYSRWRESFTWMISWRSWCLMSWNSHVVLVVTEAFYQAWNRLPMLQLYLELLGYNTALFITCWKYVFNYLGWRFIPGQENK